MAGVDAVYASLFQGWGMYYRGIYLIVDLPTDDATIGQGVNNPNIVALDNYTYTPTNDRLALFWRSTYRAINRANEAVAGVPTVAMDEALQTRLVAETRFLRALFYFNLVRLWGGVPLVTEPTSALEGLNVERATADAVYAQIVEDLQFAEANLPDVFEGQDRRAGLQHGREGAPGEGVSYPGAVGPRGAEGEGGPRRRPPPAHAQLRPGLPRGREPRARVRGAVRARRRHRRLPGERVHAEERHPRRQRRLLRHPPRRALRRLRRGRRAPRRDPLRRLHLGDGRDLHLPPALVQVHRPGPARDQHGDGHRLPRPPLRRRPPHARRGRQRAGGGRRPRRSST